MTTNKPPRPSLTKARAEKLLALAGYAEANAQELLLGGDDDRHHANEVLEACEFVRALASWRLNRKP